MLVKVLSFGSNWWVRFGRSAKESGSSPQHAAYYNSTGVRCGSKVRRHWIISGLIRFNAVSGLDPNLPDLVVGSTFICSDLVQAFGGNRLLFQAKTHWSAVPHHYLLVISSSTHGRIDFASNVWKSVLAQVIAASQLREAQEAMLLMKAGDWIQTSSGFWQLSLPIPPNEQEQLVRVGNRMSA